MAETVATSDVHVAPALLTRRLTLSLGMATACIGALSAWALAAPGSGVPFPGLISANALPLWVAQVALLATLFIAPLIFEFDEERTAAAWLIGRSVFAALWQGLTLGFFLMVASRVTPIDSQRIFLASTYLALLALSLFLLAVSVRRFFSALTFVWCVALPVSTYFLAELFLSSPFGSKGWQQTTGAPAETLRSVTHWILSLSPATALAGALSGTLADGSEFSGTVPLIVLATISTGLSFLISHRRKM